MFSKLKVFIMTFVLSLGVFGINAFADTVESRALNLDNHKHYYTYFSRTEKNKVVYTFDYSSNGVLYSNSGYVKKYHYIDGSYVFLENISEVKISLDRIVDLYTTDSELNDYCKKNATIDSFGSALPPVTAPTVGEAIQGIIPRLSTQLKNLLPVGVILLSTMLGVSLVPRLVRLFL